MDPIVFIHGYSAESAKSDPAAIAGIYGSLPQALRDAVGGVVEIDLSRYVSLEDGVTVDDISRALERALRADFPNLLQRPINVLIHSTGALVIRNWIRRHSAKPSPVRNLIYLAGANLGSGWAHIGKGQLAKWGRMVFQGGAERGVHVLDALELGSSWTLDLHLSFLDEGSTMADFSVHEFVIVGTQAHASWFTAPIRYGHEDGSDGVVRVSASNVNFNYLRFGPSPAALAVTYDDAVKQNAAHASRAGMDATYYEPKVFSRPGDPGRPAVPFAVPYECAHSGDETGVVTGAKPRAQVLELIQEALKTTDAQWPDSPAVIFAAQTEKTYDQAVDGQKPSLLGGLIGDPRAQYDHHAQVIFRIRDQDGRPIEHFDIYFDSKKDDGSDPFPVGKLFEDRHVNEVTPNVIAFYLRTDVFDKGSNAWQSQLAKIGGVYLEVSAVEPDTDQIAYLPMRFAFSHDQLMAWIEGHRTTIVDVELLRLPAVGIFKIVKQP